MKIYHNPRCTKSRLTLQLLKDKGYDPEVVLYLESPVSKDELSDILGKLGMTAKDIIRNNEKEYKENGVDKLKDNDKLLDALIKYPKLLQRPIVIHNNKAAIGRPPENVLEIL